MTSCCTLYSRGLPEHESSRGNIDVELGWHSCGSTRFSQNTMEGIKVFAQLFKQFPETPLTSLRNRERLKRS